MNKMNKSGKNSKGGKQFSAGGYMDSILLS